MSDDKDMKVLVINAGSSSIKYQLYQMPQAKVLAKGLVERIGEDTSELRQQSAGGTCTRNVDIADHEEGMKLLLEALSEENNGPVSNISEIDAVGHRVVHGGEEFTGSVLIDEKVLSSIEKFADLAPLHNPPNLTGIKAARHNLPAVPQVACFDTAFHATIAKVAYMYALPYELYQKYGIRRYGFHGTSHRYVARRAARLAGMQKYDCNVITAHLGNGCSITAVKNGKSVDTSMGLTPLEGLVMGTRCGDIDPAIIFYLAGKGYDIRAINDMFNKESGLLGISGKGKDMRTLSQLAQKGDERAALAIDIFAYRVKKYIGSYTAVLGKVDALIFTGGIGENSALVRSRICSDIPQIGFELDSDRNEAAVGKEALISTDASRSKIYVIPTNEEAAIAADTYEIALKEVSE